MKLLSLSFAVATLMTGSLAHADPQTPGFLSDYQYQVVNLPSLADAQRLMNLEYSDTRDRSVCANRAEVWSFMIEKSTGLKIGKVFIHFTDKGQADENGKWAYHVAPYVLVNGQEYVLDNGFAYFEHKPAKMSDWQNYFGKSPNCVVLDPTHNPRHLAMEQYNMPNDWVTPLEYKTGNARQYPSTEGICYVRKVPMYYWFPYQVYGADLYLSGQAKYSQYIATHFEPEDVIDACKQATHLGSIFGRENACKKYLGFKTED
jgi:hypothetical protein